MSENNFYPSYIICQSETLLPFEGASLMEDVGHPDARCRMCAMPIEQGVHCKHASKTMTNIGEVAINHETHVCEYCMRIMQTKNVRYVQGYTDDKNDTPDLFGMIYIGGDKPKAIRVTHQQAAKFILKPPVPASTPFVFIRRVHHILSNSASRHTAWFSRVSLNTKKYWLHIGNDTFLVDTETLPETIKTLEGMNSQLWPIYGTKFLVKGIVNGDKDKQLDSLITLSDHSLDNVVVAAHVIESKNKEVKKGAKK